MATPQNRESIQSEIARLRRMLSQDAPGPVKRQLRKQIEQLEQMLVNAPSAFEGTVSPDISETGKLTYISGAPTEFKGLRQGFADAMSLFLIDALKNLGGDFGGLIPGIQGLMNLKDPNAEPDGKWNPFPKGLTPNDETVPPPPPLPPVPGSIGGGTGGIQPPFIENEGIQPVTAALPVIATGLSIVNGLASLFGSDSNQLINPQVLQNTGRVENLLSDPGGGASDLAALLALFSGSSPGGLAGAGSQPTTTTEPMALGAGSEFTIEEDPAVMASRLATTTQPGTGSFVDQYGLVRNVYDNPAQSTMSVQPGFESYWQPDPNSPTGFSPLQQTILNERGDATAGIAPDAYNAYLQQFQSYTNPQAPAPTGTSRPPLPSGFQNAFAPTETTQPTTSQPVAPTRPPLPSGYQNAFLPPTGGQVSPASGQTPAGTSPPVGGIPGLTPNAFSQFVSQFSMPGFTGPTGVGPTPLQRQSTDFAGKLLNSNPFGQQANIEQTLGELISSGGRFDLSPEFSALEAVNKRRLGEERAQLREGLGSQGLRFGTDMARGDAALTADFLEREALQRSQIAREAFESATGRRLQAVGMPTQLQTMQAELADVTSGIAERDRSAQERDIQRQMAEFARASGALFPLLLQFALSGYGGDVVIPEPVEAEG